MTISNGSTNHTDDLNAILRHHAELQYAENSPNWPKQILTSGLQTGYSHRGLYAPI